MKEELSKRSNVTVSINQQCGTKITITTDNEYKSDIKKAGIKKLIDRLPTQKKDGYRIVSSDDGIAVVGYDYRGAMYGTFKLLRLFEYHKEYINLPKISLGESPDKELRGAQLGYRDKTNAYDAWDKATFAQYIRDLAIFGANAIELLPPVTDDKKVGVLQKVDLYEMASYLSQEIKSYGMDVWVWYPTVSGDEDIKTKEDMLQRFNKDFKTFTYIDHIMVPGGDPGELEPEDFFNECSLMKDVLTEYHPNAKIWISLQKQSPTDQWYDGYVERALAKPDWLYGVVHAPWTKSDPQEFYEIFREAFPIRNYPDITHSLICQYPIPYWDRSMALTLGRECINPRPRFAKECHNAYKDCFVGSIPYSEGINDDVNKFLWLGLEFCNDADTDDILFEYANIFFSSEYANYFVRGLKLLEDNLEGHLLTNRSVRQCYYIFKNLDAKISEKNYRFNLSKIRAYFDYYIQNRLIIETGLYHKAFDILEFNRNKGGLNQALSLLSEQTPCSQPLKDEIMELGDILFEQIGFQPTTYKHFGAGTERGAFLDCIDSPITNLPLLAYKLQKISKMDDIENALESLLNEKNPGINGQYYSFDDPKSFQIVDGLDSLDYGYLGSPLKTFKHTVYFPKNIQKQLQPYNIDYISSVGVLYKTPLKLLFKDLAQSNYKLIVTYVNAYGGNKNRINKIKLYANNNEIHDFCNFDQYNEEFFTHVYTIEKEMIVDNKLELLWQKDICCRFPCVAEIKLEEQL